MSIAQRIKALETARKTLCEDCAMPFIHNDCKRCCDDYNIILKTITEVKGD